MLGTTEEPTAVHYSGMAKKRPKASDSGWYAREWLAFVKKRQVDVVNHTGWSKGQVNDFVSGKQRFNRDVLLAFSAVIGCPPGALIDVNPETKDGRVMAELLLARGRTG